jgi:hypothetical protein
MRSATCGPGGDFLLLEPCLEPDMIPPLAEVVVTRILPLTMNRITMIIQRFKTSPFRVPPALSESVDELGRILIQISKFQLSDG